MVKVFMLCNPTVYLLVIPGSEGKHILCLISHLLSGWIHSFSKKPYGDNKQMRGSGEESVYRENFACLCECVFWLDEGRAEGKCMQFLCSYHMLRCVLLCCIVFHVHQCRVQTENTEAKL